VASAVYRKKGGIKNGGSGLRGGGGGKMLGGLRGGKVHHLGVSGGGGGGMSQQLLRNTPANGHKKHTGGNKKQAVLSGGPSDYPRLHYWGGEAHTQKNCILNKIQKNKKKFTWKEHRGEQHSVGKAYSWGSKIRRGGRNRGGEENSRAKSKKTNRT